MKTDVLVVGGGPAGATTARLLAAGGREVVLLERDLNHRKPCGGGIPSGGLADLGLSLDIPHKVVRELNIHFPSGRNIHIPLAGGDVKVVDRGLFDAWLRGLAEKDGASLLKGTFLNLREDDRRIISEIELNGEKHLVESDFLVAADGVNSRVRLVMGLEQNDRIYTYSSRIMGRDVSACEFWFGSFHAPGFYSWVFPKEGALSVGTGTLNPGEARVLFERFLRRAGFSPGDSQNARGFMIPRWNDGPYRKGRIFFAGDAAGQVMPFTHEGIYYAMKSGEFVAEAISAGRPGLYRKLWKKRFHGRFRLMKKIESVFLRDDVQVEKLYSLFIRKDVQDISMRLWLRKEAGRRSLLSYLNIFRKYMS